MTAPKPARVVIVGGGIGDSLALPQAADGRIFVQPNLSVPARPEAFVIGEMAALPRCGGRLHPALAQFAIQGGRHAAREIVRQLRGEPSRSFRYGDKGMTVSVGRDAGVVEAGRIRFGGRAAFFAWGTLHSLYVPGWRNRLAVDLNWIWSYATHRRAALLLLDEAIGGSPEARSAESPIDAGPRMRDDAVASSTERD